MKSNVVYINDNQLGGEQGWQFIPLTEPEPYVEPMKWYWKAFVWIMAISYCYLIWYGVLRAF